MYQLTKKELEKILVVVDKCMHATSENDINSIIDSLYEFFSYYGAVACSVEENRTCEILITNYINHSYNNSWIKEYQNNKYYYVDPVVAHSIINGGKYTLNEASVSFGGRSKRLLELCTATSEYGYTSDITYTSMDRSDINNITLFSFQTKEENENNASLALALEYLAPHVNIAIQKVINAPKENIAQPLTDRECEVLKWGAEGKTGSEISTILSISERTVKFHFNNMYRKLNVVNRGQAIAKAIQHNLIAI